MTTLSISKNNGKNWCKKSINGIDTILHKVNIRKRIAVPSPTFTWHDNLVAGYTLGGEFVTVAVIAEQSVILVGEGLVCQRAIAAETAEAVLVVMPVLVEELLAAEQETTKTL